MATLIRTRKLSTLGLAAATLALVGVTPGAAQVSSQPGGVADAIRDTCRDALGTLSPPDGDWSLATCTRSLAAVDWAAFIPQTHIEAGVTAAGNGQVLADGIMDGLSVDGRTDVSGLPFAGDVTRALKGPVAFAKGALMNLDETADDTFGKPGAIKSEMGYMVVVQLADGGADEGLVVTYAGDADDNNRNDPKNFVDLNDSPAGSDTAYVASLAGISAKPSLVAGSFAGKDGPAVAFKHGKVVTFFVANPLKRERLQTTTFAGGPPVADRVEVAHTAAAAIPPDGRISILVRDVRVGLQKNGKKLKVEGAVTSPLGAALAGATIVIEGGYGPGRKGKWKFKGVLEDQADGTFDFSGSTKVDKSIDWVYIDNLSISGGDPEASAATFAELQAEGLATGPWDYEAWQADVQEDARRTWDGHQVNPILTQGKVRIPHAPQPLSQDGLEPTASADGDGDGDVDADDLWALLGAMGTSEGSPGFDPGADVDTNGTVDASDLQQLIASWNPDGSVS